MSIDNKEGQADWFHLKPCQLAPLLLGDFVIGIYSSLFLCQLTFLFVKLQPLSVTVLVFLSASARARIIAAYTFFGTDRFLWS